MRLVRYSYPSYRLAQATRSPWSGLETEIDRFFESALRDFSAPIAPDQFPVDLYEDADNTYVRAELPGMRREDLNVEMSEGYLNISGTRKLSEGDGEETFSFSRSIDVPNEVDQSKVGASYENGVLTVTMPKREEAKPRKISVSVK